MATNSPTRKPVWVRSLYWRIVLAFCLCIGGVLAVQTTAVLLWLNSAPDPARLHGFTDAVAAELARALTENPRLDVQSFIDARYPHPLASLYIIIAETRQVVLSGPLRPPEFAVVGAQDYYRQHPAALPASWITGPYQTAPIVVRGKLAGGVGVVVPLTWRQLVGWKMAGLSGVLVLLGTGLAGLIICGPLRRQLADLNSAARRFGTGDFTARAGEGGRDELAALASSFNRMAVDLATRDDQLKAADRTRRLLLADVSHELMTPLTAIRAYREVLAMSDVAADPEAARCLDVIDDETHRLESLVGDLLDLARLETGGDLLDLHDVSVENLFGRVAAHHEPAARRQRVTITAAVSEGAEILFGDPLRLEQALQNLVANALRHTPSGGAIELRAESHAEAVLLAVRDTGTGIPPEHMPFIFDRFYKVEAARTGGTPIGSGLGLSIVKAIVERHGGTVSVLSEPSVATVFAIELPQTGIAS